METTTYQPFFEANRLLWNTRALPHFGSDFYEMDAFRQGKNMLRPIELELMGEVQGKSLLHLQCHFGQDTLSWARMGAQVTGVDISDEAIHLAKQLADELAIDARFIQSNVYDITEHLGEEQFDVVFTSYGAICWLPDLREWARLIHRHLKPGGTFLIVDTHPMLLALNFETLLPEYSYFNTHDKPVHEVAVGSYADRDATTPLDEYSWNHSLSEIWQCLTAAGLRVTDFREYDYFPYNAFSGNMVERNPGEFVFEKMPEGLAMTFAMRAGKAA